MTTKLEITGNSVTAVDDLGRATATVNTNFSTVDSVTTTATKSTNWYDIVTNKISAHSDCIIGCIDDINRKPEVPPETKSMIKCDGKNIKITYYKDGFSQNTKTIMPDIKDIIVYNDKAVVVEFADGTKEKATLHPEDNFSVECGISICITKKLMGGSSIYNKIIDHAIKVKNQCDKARGKKAKEVTEREEIKKRRAEKNKAKKEARQKNLKESIRKVIMELIKDAD